jgi:transcriptional regulator with XRE-family HTH domain
VEEGVRGGSPYGQLLWESGCVKACPEHGIKLVETCGCTSGQALNPRKTKFLPHICECCGDFLAGRIPSDLEAPSDQELGFARSVGKLLGSPVFEGCLVESKQNALAEFLKDAVRDIGEGNAACIAKILDVSKGGLSDWYHGRHMLSLPQAIHIAETFGSTLAEVLEGTTREGAEPVKPVSIHWRPQRAYFRRPSAEGLAYRLEAILQEERPISLAEAARRLGTSTRELYRLYQGLACAMAARAKTWKCEETKKRREERLEIVREIADEMIFVGIIPIQKLLEKRITEIPKSSLFRERNACKRLCKESCKAMAR